MPGSKIQSIPAHARVTSAISILSDRIVCGDCASMFYLLANNGPQAGRKYELKGDKSVLGRHPDCDVVIEVGAVSRNHCQVVREGNSYRLEDLGSRNGTFLNDEPEKIN